MNRTTSTRAARGWKRNSPRTPTSSRRREAAKPRTRAAVEAFEPRFFANLTLVLDASFVHRTRALEGKDGNPLNEVRMLCSSLLTNDGVLAADKTIKYTPETSVLKLRVGDEIRLDEKQFLLLFEALRGARTAVRLSGDADAAAAGGGELSYSITSTRRLSASAVSVRTDSPTPSSGLERMARATTSGIVRSRMVMSSPIDQFSM